MLQGLIDWLRKVFFAVVRLLGCRRALEHAPPLHFHRVVATRAERGASGCASRSALVARIIAEEGLQHSPLGRKRVARSVAAWVTRRRLLANVAALRAIPLTEGNAAHEAALKVLWESMRPGSAYLRLDKQWGEIGFQGRDPATDLRGLGILGLGANLALATRREAVAAILGKTDLPLRGYPLAITCLAMLDFAVSLTSSGALDLWVGLPHAVAGGSSGEEGSSEGEEDDSLDTSAVPLVSDTQLLAALRAWLAGEEAGVALPPATSHVAAVLRLLNVASSLLLLFDEHWDASCTRSVMDYPPVFASFKAAVLQHLESAGGAGGSATVAGVTKVAPWPVAGGHPHIPFGLLPLPCTQGGPGIGAAAKAASSASPSTFTVTNPHYQAPHLKRE